jgi:hypothetical protein
MLSSNRRIAVVGALLLIALAALWAAGLLKGPVVVSGTVRVTAARTQPA